MITASDGLEALRSAIAEPPDLILSDVMMPGLDGFGLLKELRARAETRTIPVDFFPPVPVRKAAWMVWTPARMTT